MNETAPSGTVSLVFTDIQGSSALWDEAPEPMRGALALHDETIRRLIKVWGGYEVKTEGDAFMVAFSDPEVATRFCLDIQTTLLGTTWPEALMRLGHAMSVNGADGRPIFRGLRVRCGVHTVIDPECRRNPVSGRVDYYGPNVNLAASVGAAGHGGQVLVSGPTWEQIRDRIPGVQVRHLGTWCLKGIRTPMSLVEVLPGELGERTFPPPRVAGGRPTNLGSARRRLLGRDTDLATLDQSFKAGARLVTIVGPGGMGKTTLARTFATSVMDRFPGGTWFVELASTRDGRQVADRVSMALGVGSLPSGDSSDTLMAALRARGRTLLVLDNVEQVIEQASPLVRGWIQAAPEARFLVTSREALDILEEERLELLSLSEGDAVTLFQERAAEAGATVPDSQALRELVRALDGIPLALELAAARASMMAPETMLARLPEQRFQVLRSQRRDADPRHATLFAAIAWSWDLLTPVEQDVLAQCAVFRGTFDLPAAEAVLDLSAHPDAPWSLDIFTSLRRRSLLRVEGDDAPRFALYESVRTFAKQRLETEGRMQATCQRHAAWFLSWAEGLNDQGVLDGSPDLLHALGLDKDDLLAVVERGDDEQTLRAVLALAPLHNNQGPFAEHLALLRQADRIASQRPRDRRWVELQLAWLRVEGREAHYDEAIARGRQGIREADAQGLTHLASRLRAELGRIFRWSGQMDQARICFHEVEHASDPAPSALAFAWAELGISSMHDDDMAGAEDYLHQALDLAQSIQDQGVSAHAWSIFGVTAASRHSLERGAQAFEKAAHGYEALGMVIGITVARNNLAELLYYAGSPGQAIAHIDEGIRLASYQGYDVGVSVCQVTKAWILQGLGMLAEAESLSWEALRRAERMGDEETVMTARLMLGVGCLEAGLPEKATKDIETGVAMVDRFPLVGISGLARTWQAWNQALLGRHEQVVAYLTGTPWSLDTWDREAARIGIVRSTLHRLIGDNAQAEAVLRRILQASGKYGYGFVEFQAVAGLLGMGFEEEPLRRRYRALWDSMAESLSEEMALTFRARWPAP